MQLPPNVHRNDSATSAIAAANHHEKRMTNLQLVLYVVRMKPGQTASEIGLETGLGRVEAARRLSDGKTLGLLVRGPSRKGVYGTKEVTWEPVNQQGALM